jgi:hypothetical protein
VQLTREELLMKLGAARDQSRMAWRLAVIEVAYLGALKCSNRRSWANQACSVASIDPPAEPQLPF